MRPESERNRRRRRWGAAAFLVLAVFALDVSRAPAEQWSAKALVLAIDVYQLALSPRMSGMGVRCRFTPTCSHYGEESIKKYGALVGTARAAWRVLRCGPWTAAGTVDPP